MIISILGKYYYLEVTNAAAGSDYATIRSETFPANDKKFGKRLSFFYNMNGTDVGKLDVILHELSKTKKKQQKKNK